MTVIGVIQCLLFLFFFFELPPVDDNTTKSKYEKYLEHNHQQQQIENSSDKLHVNDNYSNINQNAREQRPNCDPLLSASDQEKLPLMADDDIKDMPTPTEVHRNVAPQSLNFIKRVYWLLNG